MGTFKNPDVWKQNLAYQIGDFVLYNGVVYMAIKPVPAGTAMSADYWNEFAEGAIVPTGDISITENGEVDVAQYATANVNVEGGGSSDFTTATVTVVNNKSSEISVMIAIAVDSIEEDSYLIPLLYVNKNGTSPVLAPLYKGHGIAIFSSGTLSIEGSATDLGDGAVNIAGDCTITVS